jgi:hypothetical protein
VEYDPDIEFIVVEELMIHFWGLQKQWVIKRQIIKMEDIE